MQVEAERGGRWWHAVSAEALPEASALPPALADRPHVHTLRTGGRAADNLRLVARVRASGQGWQQISLKRCKRGDDVRERFGLLSYSMPLSLAWDSLIAGLFDLLGTEIFMYDVLYQRSYAERLGFMATIRPVSYLQRRIGELTTLAKETREPIYLTKNGIEHLVLMDADAFAELQKKAEKSESRNDQA